MDLLTGDEFPVGSANPGQVKSKRSAKSGNPFLPNYGSSYIPAADDQSVGPLEAGLCGSLSGWNTDAKPPLAKQMSSNQGSRSSNNPFSASLGLSAPQSRAQKVSTFKAHEEQQSLLDMDMPAVPSFVRHSAPIARMTEPVESYPGVGRMNTEDVARWFKEAGANPNGILEPSKAAVFFQRSGVGRTQLSQVWNNCKRVDPQSSGKGLNLAQFTAALRLIALAQTGRELSERNMSQALTDRSWAAAGNLPLPGPRIDDPTDQIRGRLDVPKAQPSDSGILHDNPPERELDIPRIPSAFATSPNRPGWIKTPPIQVSEHERQPSGNASPISCRTSAADRIVPVCFEARLPPLHARPFNLSFLAASHGSLFAGPSSIGGVLQWAEAEGEMRRAVHVSEHEGLKRRANAAVVEDVDAAKSSEIDVRPCKNVTCMHVDETSGVLWVGHRDGNVSGYSLGNKPGMPVDDPIARFQAYKSGRVTAICTSPYGDVWTGSSRGVIRVRRVTWVGGKEQWSEPRELRRQGGMKAATHSICFLVMPSSGQVIWSGTPRSMHIWDTLTGQFLGSVHRANDLNYTDKQTYVHKFENSERDVRYVPRLQVDPNKGLELDEHGRVVTGLRGQPHVYREDFTRNQEHWAAQTDKGFSEWVDNVNALGGKAIDISGKAAGKCIKGMNKLGGKLLRNLNSKMEGQSHSVELSRGSASSIQPDGRFTHDLSEAPPSDEEPDGPEMYEGDTKHHKKHHRIAHMIAGQHNCIWVSWNYGRIDRYHMNGKLELKKEMGIEVCSMAAVGLHIWCGLADGRIRILHSNRTREWRAHQSAVISLVPCGSRVYSLAADGSISGWCSTSPSDQDVLARQQLDAVASSMMELRHHEILCLTWNVNETKPAQNFFDSVTKRAAQGDLCGAVFALQEIEMGGSSLALGVAKDRLHKKAQEKGNQNGQWWARNLHLALGTNAWKQAGLRQLSGMLVIVFCKIALEGEIGEVSTASVACGVLGVAGNKGAVAVSFTLNRRRVACICSHFAAHQTATENRRQNYVSITKNLTFSNLPQSDSSVLLDDAYIPKETKVSRNSQDSRLSDSESEEEVQIPILQGQGMRSAEVLIWLGDFNYRINYSYEDTVELIKHNWLDKLLEQDQCKIDMKAGVVFRQLREGPINFAPTYKFDKGKSDPFAYDSSEKRRVPSWTDRILFRGSSKRELPDDDALAFAGGSDLYKEQRTEVVSVDCVEYTSDMSIIDSDHKPVWCRLTVDLPVIIQEQKRRKCSELLKQCFEASLPEPPRVSFSTNNVVLNTSPAEVSVLTVTNEGNSDAVVAVRPSPQPGTEHTSIPTWLSIFPCTALIAPKSKAAIRFACEERPGPRMTNLRTLLTLHVDHPYGAGGAAMAGTSRHSFSVVCDQ